MIPKFSYDCRMTAEEKDELQRLVAHELPKTLKHISDVQQVDFTVNVHDATGQRKKYSVHISLLAKGKTYHADHAHWKFTDAVHHAFSALRTQFE